MILGLEIMEEYLWGGPCKLGSCGASPNVGSGKVIATLAP